MSSFAPRPKAQSREGIRQSIIVAAVGACLGLGLLAAGGYVAVTRHPAAVDTASNDDEIYTGSILYMPYEGRICHQFLFDNHTGRLSDNGSVDCDRAAYQGTDATPKHWSFARMRVISTGFRDR
jgi:hypothetical protein